MLSKTHSVRKINKANRLFGLMIYQVKFFDVELFFKVRSRIERMFGPSVEYEFYKKYAETIYGRYPAWSWNTITGKEWKGHIYLIGDQQLEIVENEIETLKNVKKI